MSTTESQLHAVVFAQSASAYLDKARVVRNRLTVPQAAESLSAFLQQGRAAGDQPKDAALATETRSMQNGVPP